MSQDLVSVWAVLGSIWTNFFTGFKLPLVNMTPATLLFGILSFMVAIKLIKGILTVSVDGASDRARRSRNE